MAKTQQTLSPALGVMPPVQVKHRQPTTKVHRKMLKGSTERSVEAVTAIVSDLPMCLRDFTDASQQAAMSLYKDCWEAIQPSQTSPYGQSKAGNGEYDEDESAAAFSRYKAAYNGLSKHPNRRKAREELLLWSFRLSHDAVLSEVSREGIDIVSRALMRHFKIEPTVKR